LSLALALVVTVLFNADTLHLTKRLWSDGALREAVVAMAQQAPAEPKGDLVEQLLAQVQQLESSVLPLGWYWEGDAPLPCARRATASATSGCWQPSAWSRVLLVVGWSVTALAVSLGATFWFDLLSRALRLRSTGAKVSSATGRVVRSTAEVAP
jgi:hypothetical protein